jgi:hypothetical protein
VGSRSSPLNYAPAVAPVSTLIQLEPSENTKFPVPLPAVSDAFNASEQKIILPVLAEAEGRSANAIAVDVKPLVDTTGPEKVVVPIVYTPFI